MNRKFSPLFALMAAAEAVTSTGAGAAVAAAPAVAPVPDSNVAAAAKPKRAPKNPENVLDIINGRLPLALVFCIRFKELAGTTNELAKKYGTSVGKVFDIKKGRNFGYIGQDYLPSAEEIEAAKAWCTTGKTAKGKSLKEAGGDPDAILTMVNSLTVATAEQVASRNWQIRVVGEAKPAAAGTAPVAAAAAAAAPAAPADKTEAKADKTEAKAGKTEAKLF